MNPKLQSQSTASALNALPSSRSAGACLLAILLPAAGATAQTNYAILWWSVDGGGGDSGGGQYAVRGTLGQPEAGTISGGSFTLTGGFWSLISAVQTPGAPYLSVTRSNAVVVVAWPQSAEGWSLTYRTVLAGGTNNWTPIPPPYQTNATHYYVVEPNPAGNRFYRLQQP